jgi:hypothetical protein
MPRAEGGAVASLDGSTLHVMYLSMFGVPYEQSLDLNTATPDQRSWRTDGVHRLPALGQPLGLTVNGRREAVFLAARAWPRRPPFVFDWNERRRVPGYRTYQGERNTLVYAKEIGQRFKNQFPIDQTTDQLEGQFTLFSNAENSSHYLAFRGTEGGIRAGVHRGETWAMTRPSKLAKAPKAKGDPIGWVDGKTGTRYYLYEGSNGHIHELSLDDGQWTHRRLTSN